jgi:uncharacterized membrane protein (UPF0127 family)
MIEHLSPTSAGVTLTNARSRQVIARDVELALTRSARRQGLLQRPSLPAGTAILLAPCFMVHTAFMQFPIDIVFVDRRGYVRHMRRDVGPWRMTASFRAYATIELPAGTLAKHDIVVGDQLCLGVAMSLKLSA